MLWGASRKQILIAVLILVAIALPAFLFSGIGTSMIQQWVDNHRDSPKAPGRQLMLAKIYRYTLRLEKEVRAYAKYLDYFSAANSPGNYDAAEYKRVGYLWCVRGEETTSTPLEKVARYYWFLGLYRDAMPGDPEVREAELRYQHLNGIRIYNGWP